MGQKRNTGLMGLALAELSRGLLVARFPEVKCQMTRQRISDYVKRKWFS